MTEPKNDKQERANPVRKPTPPPPPTGRDPGVVIKGA